jgi:pyruvate dehydrogenase E2 component (dihydrolipoamide acetyltransferase)
VSDTIQVRVPDIGDFKDIPVIEVLVKPGDTIAKETPLVVLESDKASMEVPSPAAGTVTEVNLKVGDKVSEGTVILSAAPQGAESRDTVILSAAPSGAESKDSNAPLSAAPSGAESKSKSTAESTIDIPVPDIGDFKDVPVIEILVKPGDTVAKEAPLVVLESDKASMEVPASAAGVVEDIRVKLGDKVSQGSIILTLRTAAPVAPSTTALRASVQDDTTPPSTAALRASAQDDTWLCQARKSQTLQCAVRCYADGGGEVDAADAVFAHWDA